MSHQVHPRGDTNANLFRGVPRLEDAHYIMQNGCKMDPLTGDLNPGTDHELVKGKGAPCYLTDSLIAAAQYVCHSKETADGSKITHVHVVSKG